MTNPQRFVQAPHNARELFQDAPGKIEGEDTAGGGRDEVLERDGRAQVLLDEVKVTGSTNGFEYLCGDEWLVLSESE
jgi:hypothetical protein